MMVSLVVSFFKGGVGVSFGVTLIWMVASSSDTSTMFEWGSAFPPPPFPRALVSGSVDRTASVELWEVAEARGGTGGECSRVALGGDCIDWALVAIASFGAWLRFSSALERVEILIGSFV